MAQGGMFCLDLATVTGFSYGMPGQPPIWGSRRNGGAPGVPIGAIIADFEDWIAGQLDLLKPGSVWVEAPYIARGMTMNPATVLVLYGLRAALLAAVWRRDLVCRDVNIKTVERHFTGVAGGRRQDKKRLTIEMCERYGWHVASDDEADALALLMYAEAQLYPGAAAHRSAGPLWAKSA